MPPEQQIDQQLIDQTKREIGRLVTEIEYLANQDIAESDFYAEYLRRIVQALAAQAAALWVKTPTGGLKLEFQINLHSVGIEAGEFQRQAHDGLLRYTIMHAKPALVQPHSGPGGDADATNVNNPTDFLIVLAPIILDGATIGIVEVFQDGSRRSTAQQGYLRFLIRIAEEAAKYLKYRRLRHFQSQQELFDQLGNFTRAVQGGLDPKQVMFLIANEGKKLIQCERCSVGLRRGRKTTIEAISGQDSVEKRSNLVQRMARLVDRVLIHGENFLYKGQVDDQWPSDIRQANERYLEESGSKLIAIIPLEDAREFGSRSSMKAALIVEMVEDTDVPGDMGGRVDAVCKNGGPALFNSLEHHRIPLLPVMKAVGGMTQWFTGQNLPKVVIGVILATVLIAGLILIPWPLRLEGRGELVPREKRTIFAPLTGTIRSVKVDHDDPVEDGSLLAEMFNPELEREESKLQDDLRVAEQEMRALEAERRAKGGFDNELGGKIEQVRQQITSYQQQLRLVRQQNQKLRVVSPIHGKVMDWKPKERLSMRPVQQGDVLMEIADTDGDWVLEVQFPENTVTHIARARAEHPNGRLPVTFVLSASPDTTYKGELYEVATQAKPVEEENVIDAKISLDNGQELSGKVKTEMVSGVEVRVKVDCGNYPVGYVLFRELIDFVREYVFF